MTSSFPNIKPWVTMDIEDVLNGKKEGDRQTVNEGPDTLSGREKEDEERFTGHQFTLSFKN